MSDELSEASGRQALVQVEGGVGGGKIVHERLGACTHSRAFNLRIYVVQIAGGLHAVPSGASGGVPAAQAGLRLRLWSVRLPGFDSRMYRQQRSMGSPPSPCTTWSK